MRRVAFGVAGLILTAVLAAQEKISTDLQALVDTERSFAHAATLKGVRDAFLDFFADDGIALTPLPTSATARLRSRPAQPFSATELKWEPRTGDIARSGELGWLTGPSSFHAPNETKLQHGNYLSVWRKQTDGHWRVFIDVGVLTPQAVTFAPGFTRFPFGDRYAGKEGRAASASALLAADRDLNERIASGGTAQAYRARLAAEARLHRFDVLSIVGRRAIADWLDQHAASMSATSGAADVAEAGDIGYSYGTYALKGDGAERGAYVRVWTRDGAGSWLIVADVTQPTPPV